MELAKSGGHKTRKKFAWVSRREVGLNSVRTLIASGLKETES